MVTAVNRFPDIHTSFPMDSELIASQKLACGPVTWRDFAYVTMAQKVPSSTLVQLLQPKVPYSKRSDPHIYPSPGTLSHNPGRQ